MQERTQSRRALDRKDFYPTGGDVMDRGPILMPYVWSSQYFDDRAQEQKDYDEAWAEVNAIAPGIPEFQKGNRTPASGIIFKGQEVVD